MCSAAQCQNVTIGKQIAELALRRTKPGGHRGARHSFIPRPAHPKDVDEARAATRLAFATERTPPRIRAVMTNTTR